MIDNSKSVDYRVSKLLFAEAKPAAVCDLANMLVPLLLLLFQLQTLPVGRSHRRRR